MVKRFFIVGLFVAGFVNFVSAAQISLDPIFAEERFVPANVFHASCLNEIAVTLKSTPKENISSLRLIVNYDPSVIQILNIKAADGFKNTLDTAIEYDKIVATVLDAPISGDITKLFTIVFKSTETATGSLFAIRKPSYVMSKNTEKIPVFSEQNVSFAQVAECEPDSLPPIISLIKPSTDSGTLAIDSYFTFSITDSGKGVDKNSIRIHFAGKTYSGSDSALIWDENKISFYPENRIPLDSKLDLSLRIADKQEYGGANETKKVFNFKTGTGIIFDQNITPAMLRAGLNNLSKLLASSEQCSGMINTLIASNNIENIAVIEGLAEKMGCAFDGAAISKAIQDVPENEKIEGHPLSVFAITGWLLFVLSFLLKVYYMISERKQRKIIKSSLS